MSESASASLPPYARLRAHRERAVPDEADSVLAEGVVAHVGIVDDGRPVVIPMTYHVDSAYPEMLFLHGGHESRLLRHLASGAPVCVTMTLVDGLVYSRTALNHSVNYRSVVCFAEAAEPLPEAEARDLLHGLIGRYFPGRLPGQDYEPMPDTHLAATAFVPLRIVAKSAKARRGGPNGPRDGSDVWPGSAGVVALNDKGARA